MTDAARETIAQVTATFEAARKGDAALAEAHLAAPLRIVPGKRAIFDGRLGATRAVFRFYIDHPEAHALRDWTELQRSAAYMQTGPYRVNAPLAHVPVLGCVVVAHAPGQPLMEKLWSLKKPERTTYMRPAAEWLRAYTAPTEERRTLRLDGWLARAEKGAARQPFEELHAVEAALLARIKAMAAAMEGQSWRVAISHGDFHPNNLLSDGDTLTGIDTGGSAQLAFYKDVARFLTHMGRRGLTADGGTRYGVCAKGLAAFEQVFALDEAERRLFLPFFFGIEALVRVEARFFSMGRLRRSKAFYEALLADLRALDL
jgi:hypothetical protein